MSLPQNSIRGLQVDPIPNSPNRNHKYSVALVMTFLAAESENRQLKDLPQADLGRAPERFLLSVRTNSITDNFVY